MKKLYLILLLLVIPMNIHATDLTLTCDDDPNNTAVKFRMYKQLNCSNSFVPIGDIIFPTLTFTEPNITTGTNCYQVTALDSLDVESIPSNTLTVTCSKGAHKTINCSGV